MTIARRLMANSISGLVERFLNLFVQIWLYQYLLKRISPEEYSLYPVVTALLVFVPPLMVVLTSGLLRDTVEADALNNNQRVTEITSTIFPILLTAALSLIVLALVVAKYLAFILNISPADLWEARLMVLLLLGSLSLRLVLIPFSVGLYVRQKFVLANTLTMLQTVFRLALLLGLLLGAGPRVLWVVVASVAADVATIVVTTVLSVRAVPALTFRVECIRRELLSQLMTFGFWNMIGSIGAIIRKSSDLLILNRFATPIDVNTFHLASLTDNQIDAALDKTKEPLTPHMVAVYANGGREALRTLCTRTSRYYMWAALFVTTSLIAFRQPLWSRYLGSELDVYASVPLVMVLLLARYWIEGPVCLISTTAYAMHRMRTLSILVIASSLSNVAITIYFVHYLHMGAVGSALGTLISTSAWSLGAMWKLSLDLLGLEFGAWFKTAVWQGVLPSLVSGFFALGWSYWLPPDTIPELILVVAILACVYALTVLLFCLNEDERRQLNQLFAKLSSQKAF